MGKARAVLDVLPSVYGAADEGKLLAHAVRALADPLEAADGELYRIQQAHRLPVAPHARDILNLAAALDLEQVHFEDLLAPGIEHELRLTIMRERVRRIASLHLDGLGTPGAVMGAAAILLGAGLVADAPGEPPLRRLDPDGYSHRAIAEFHHAPGRPRETIVLHENPFRRLKVDMAPRWPEDGWTAENGNRDVSPVRIAIRGVAERTVLPTVFCPGLPAGVVFNGIVPEGETLVVDQHGGATLGGRDVSRWLLVYRGGMYDYADADRAGYAVTQGEELDPFGGDEDLEEDTRWRRPRPDLPRPPLGRSSWHFHVAGGIYDGAGFDFAVFDPPEVPVGVFDEDPPFDACVFDLPPSGVVGMAWDERIACAFKLLLPAHVPSPGPATAEPLDHRGRIAALLPRFRAAGVTAFVETAPDAWELGRSVLRPADAADGEGVDFHSVRLVSRATENLVPFDPGGQPTATRP